MLAAPSGIRLKMYCILDQSASVLYGNCTSRFPRFVQLSSFLNSHLRCSFCGAILLHKAKVWRGVLLYLYFSHSSIIKFGRGA